MGWPQIIWIVMASVHVGIHLCNDGQRKDDRYNFVGALCGALLMAWILSEGGFFG